MAPVSRQPITHARPLFERRRELEALDTAFSELRAPAHGVGPSRGGLLAFTGPGGLGKTALLSAARTRAVGHGFTVLSGRGGEAEQDLAFRLVRQLVQPSLAAMDETELRKFLGSWYPIVAPALGLEAADNGLPDPTGVRDGLDWVMTRLTLKKAPVVLLLDDLHWVDLESLGWLTSFAPRVADLPLLIISAYRPAELPPEAAGFGSLIEDHGPRPYSLAPLSTGAVARIVREEVGEQAEDEFCAECWSATGGSPFETVEIALGLAERNLKGTREDLPAMRDLAAAVKGPGLLDRLNRLGTSTVRFTHAAAVLGSPFSPAIAAALAAVGSEAAAEAVEKLRAARIVAEGDAPGGSLDFAHPIIARTIYRSIPAHFRSGYHNAAAVAVRAAGFGPGAAARHLMEVPCEGKPEAVESLREAAHEYLRAGAPEAARRLLSRALQEPPLPEQRAALLHQLACATFLIEPTATVTHLREALAEPGLDPELRASIVYRLTQALAHTGRMAEAATVAEEEAKTCHPRIRLRMQGDHFVWSMFRTDERDSSARSRRLTKLAERLPGRGPEERWILGLRAWDSLLRGEPRRSVLRYAEDALRGGMSWTDENRGFEVPVSVALTFMHCDQPRRAEELFTRGMAECEAKGWRGSHLALGQTLFGYIRYRRGNLIEAEHWVRQGLRTAERVEGAVPAQWFAVGILIQTLLARGRPLAARRLADEHEQYGRIVPNAVIYPDPRTVYAELLLAEGRHAEAAELLGEVGAWLEGRDWRNPSWCPWRLDLSAALARTAPDRAVRVARDAVAHARDFGAASVIGQALRTEAEVTGGRAALELYAEAVERLEQSPSAYELARALVGHGAALSRYGRLQDAADRLYQGLEVAVHCGAEALAGRAREELSTAGLRPLPLRYAQTDTLTGHERRAAELAAQGRPVSMVAKELHLTEQGVRQLLSAVYRKLGTDPAGLVDALEALPRA
ncbi:helix-turn-helix transcriptional regulator [Streptomyces sp.]|uniref:helix-turn-helix transcriptional regulator n=1 Tax=Streptomyces sp. TaxID=1931 RepID=UPI002D3B66E7|nr:AAA family ATPase [Streptomyces sp.]HZF91079.1 AAA family ATPase [Streptomyces sp.]